MSRDRSTFESGDTAVDPAALSNMRAGWRLLAKSFDPAGSDGSVGRGTDVPPLIARRIARWQIEAKLRAAAVPDPASPAWTIRRSGRGSEQCIAPSHQISAAVRRLLPTAKSQLRLRALDAADAAAAELLAIKNYLAVVVASARRRRQLGTPPRQAEAKSDAVSLVAGRPLRRIQVILGRKEKP